jgi:hypothetical protein
LAALKWQVAQIDTLSAIVNNLVNATIYQVDIRPLLHGFETVVIGLRTEAREVAEEAKAAVAAAATPSVKAETASRYADWQYWWSWWQATWNQSLSVFFLGFSLGFSLYQAESRAHTVLFFAMGFYFSPYLGGMALLVVIVRKCVEW